MLIIITILSVLVLNFGLWIIHHFRMIKESRRQENIRYMQAVEDMRKPWGRAYTLLHLDISCQPPKVLGAGVFSSNEITNMYPVLSIPVHQAPGASYQDAHDTMYEILRQPYNKWLYDLVRLRNH